ncbi:putative Response regulator consisting of a CheY-like receiver domain [Candidatus Terasakiella magnetica]|uniref:Putative Response regulator consisting of a CheY-like receiver domain n=1 Tax=Candidatus Terasakiella magnetica TaxID=1867952 RepID=A0A1C3RJB3_9PROT|nr:response regulator [Candidatus Terasakiella magnetica]SCA57343.1 putative Response regulator consisting of a CheY-like receiver domain [Candidatus Terasakiella magnetica]
MKDLSFTNVRMALGEPSLETRRALSAVLHQKGFHDIIPAASLETIVDSVTTDRADLIVCDAHIEGGDLYQLVHDIRHGKIGSNPFLVIIILADQPDVELVKRLVDAGVDDILTKPITAGKFADHIIHLSKHRKDFVVTVDYIGPDRRKDGPRPGTQVIPTIKVPNPLQDITSGSNLNKIKHEIEDAKRKINEQQVERLAYQACYLSDHLVSAYDSEPDKEVVPMITRLEAVTSELEEKLPLSSYAHARKPCSQLLDMAHRLHREPLNPKAENVQRLSVLSQELHDLFVQINPDAFPEKAHEGQDNQDDYDNSAPFDESILSQEELFKRLNTME